MNVWFSRAFRHTANGTLWGFLAEALILPTGLITAVYLTRKLGPEGYGLFTLAATLAGWIAFTATSWSSRAAIKFVSEADDWRPIGATILRLHLACGVAAALILWLAAEPIAALLGEPKLTVYLKLFALEPLLYILAWAHRSILIGIGNFRRQAAARALRWLARLLLIVLLVEMGLSIFGAVLGSIGATLVELLIYRFYVRPSLFLRSTFRATQLWSFAKPLLLSALCIQIFSKIDLLAVTALGGTAAVAGIYGAATNLAFVPGLLALSLSPLLLSTMGRALKSGQDPIAHAMAREAMRLVIAMLPFAGMAAGTAHELVVVIFGADFSPAAPLLALLIFGQVGMVMISVATAMTIVADRLYWTVAITGSMLLMAVVGHVLLIPRLGAIGAAIVTTSVEGLGALAAICYAYSLWRVSPSLKTSMRSVLLCAVAYAIAVVWPAAGLWIVPKLIAITIMIPVGFLLLGEFDAREIEVVRSIMIKRYPSSETVQKITSLPGPGQRVGRRGKNERHDSN